MFTVSGSVPTLEPPTIATRSPRPWPRRSGRVAALLAGDLPHGLVEHAEEAGRRAAALRRRAGHPLQLRALDRPVPPRAGRPPAADVAAGGRPVRAARAARASSATTCWPGSTRAADRDPDGAAPTSTWPRDAAERAARLLELLDDPDASLDHLVVTDPRAAPGRGPPPDARSGWRRSPTTSTRSWRPRSTPTPTTSTTPRARTIAFERSQVGALVRQARERLAEVDAALARLDDGTYGVVRACGRPVGAGRLEARPEARTCIDCARAQVAPDDPKRPRAISVSSARICVRRQQRAVRGGVDQAEGDVRHRPGPVAGSARGAPGAARRPRRRRTPAGGRGRARVPRRAATPSRGPGPRSGAPAQREVDVPARRVRGARPRRRRRAATRSRPTASSSSLIETSISARIASLDGKCL